MPKKTDAATSEIISQIPRGSPVQDVFGWTIPVEQIPLPSGGLIYPAGSTLHGKDYLQIKAMTAQEEDILMSRALWKDGSITSRLIGSCLIDKTVDPADLLSGDRNALLVAIRITGYGSDYKATATCGSCGKSDSYVFDLSSLEIKRLAERPVHPGVNEFAFVLPVSKKRVTFKLTTVRDEEEEKITKEKMQKLFPGAKQEGVVTSMLDRQVVSIDGKTDRVAISAFIRAMPAGDSRALRGYMANVEPGLITQVSFTCNFCDAESRVALPVGASFFWPE